MLAVFGVADASNFPIGTSHKHTGHGTQVSYFKVHMEDLSHNEALGVAATTVFFALDFGSFFAFGDFLGFGDFGFLAAFALAALAFGALPAAAPAFVFALAALVFAFAVGSCSWSIRGQPGGANSQLTTHNLGEEV